MSSLQGSQRPTVPGDLVLVAVLGAGTAAVGVLGVSGLAGQVALGILGVLFAPGYALVSLLFPAEKSAAGFFETTRARAGPSGGQTENDGGVSIVERLVLAIGASVCIVPLTGVGMAFTPWRVRPAPVLGTIGVLTVLLAVGAAVRRWKVPPRERFDPRMVEFIADAVHRYRAGTAGSNVTLLLVVGLLVAASGIGFAALSTERGEQFTEFYLATESGPGGETVGADYPQEITQGEQQSVQVGITNREGETTSYTVVVLLQSFGEDGAVSEVQRLDTFSASVGSGETWEQSHTVRPEMTGENLRVTYLLYVGSAPDDPALGTASAYRSAHIWVDVSP